MKNLYYEFLSITDFNFRKIIKEQCLGAVVHSDYSNYDKIFLKKLLLSNKIRYCIFFPENLLSSKEYLKFFDNLKEKASVQLLIVDGSNVELYFEKIQNILEQEDIRNTIILDFGVQFFLGNKVKDQIVFDHILKIQNQFKTNFVVNFIKRNFSKIQKNHSFFDFIMNLKFFLKKTKQQTINSLNLASSMKWNFVLELFSLEIPFQPSVKNMISVILNEQGQILFMNREGLEKTRYALDEVVGKSWFELFIFPKDREKLSNIFNSLLLNQSTYFSFQNRIKTKTNQFLSIEWINYVNYDVLGNIVGTLSLGVDKTLQEKTIEQTMETLSNYEFLMRHFQMIFYKLEYNIQSNQMRLIFIDDIQNIIPKQFYTVFTSSKLKKEIKKNIDLKNKKTQYFSIEIQNGEEMLYLQNNLIFIRQEEEKYVYSCLLLNQTEIREQEKELKLLNKAVNNLFEYMVITDINGKILFVNDTFEKITLYSREEVLGKNLRILNSGKLPKQFFKELWDTILSGRTWLGRFINRRKNGDIYTEEAIISPVFDNDKNITNFIAIKKDITKELSLWNDIIQYKKMSTLGQFTAGLVHDLNNILTAISGNATMLSLNYPENEEVAEIKASVKDAQNLMEHILAFVRKKRIQFQTIDVREYAKKLKKLCRSLISNNINLTFSSEKELGKINFDETLLNDIFLNLISNSMKAIKDKGAIEIYIKNYRQNEIGFIPLGDYVLFTVKDTGKGMSRFVQKHIFDPFFTTAEKNFQKGTGLGLSNVYSFVKQGKGYIFVESEENKGTTFFIYFPVGE